MFLLGLKDLSSVPHLTMLALEAFFSFLIFLAVSASIYTVPKRDTTVVTYTTIATESFIGIPIFDQGLRRNGTYISLHFTSQTGAELVANGSAVAAGLQTCTFILSLSLSLYTG